MVGAELAASQELIARIATYLVRCGAPADEVEHTLLTLTLLLS